MTTLHSHWNVHFLAAVHCPHRRTEMTRLMLIPAILTLTSSPWWTQYGNVVLSNILPLCGCHRDIVTVLDIIYIFLWSLPKFQFKFQKNNSTCQELDSPAFYPCIQTTCLPLQVVKMEMERDKGNIMLSTPTLRGTNPLLSASFSQNVCFLITGGQTVFNQNQSKQQLLKLKS